MWMLDHISTRWLGAKGVDHQQVATQADLDDGRKWTRTFPKMRWSKTTIRTRIICNYHSKGLGDSSSCQKDGDTQLMFTEVLGRTRGCTGKHWDEICILEFWIVLKGRHVHFWWWASTVHVFCVEVMGESHTWGMVPSFRAPSQGIPSYIAFPASIFCENLHSFEFRFECSYEILMFQALADALSVAVKEASNFFVYRIFLC